MKAVISNRIYLQVTDEYKEVLSKELTYTIPSYNPKDPPIVIKNMARIRGGLVTIPVGRTDLIPEGYEIVDTRINMPVELPRFKHDLRSSQKDVYDEVEDNCIINAWVSWGKTFTGLAIAGKLGQKTLVVVHTVPLRNQWTREVENVFGFTPGIIGSGKFNISPPIVIGNTQSLYRNIPRVSKEFGTIQGPAVVGVEDRRLRIRRGRRWRSRSFLRRFPGRSRRERESLLGDFPLLSWLSERYAAHPFPLLLVSTYYLFIIFLNFI